MKRVSSYLYWVTGVDEDWFVIAESEHDAELFFSNHEGCDKDDCFAEEIALVSSKTYNEKDFKKLVKVSKDNFEKEYKNFYDNPHEDAEDVFLSYEYLVTAPVHAQLEDLEKLGFEILNTTQPRYVSFTDDLHGVRLFVEGTTEYRIQDIKNKLDKNGISLDDIFEID